MLRNVHSVLKAAANAPGREHEQSIIRLIIGISVFLYITVTHLNEARVFQIVSIQVLIYVSLGVFILAWIYSRPVKVRSRYICSTIVDVIGLSYAIHLGNEWELHYIRCTSGSRLVMDSVTVLLILRLVVCSVWAVSC